MAQAAERQPESENHTLELIVGYCAVDARQSEELFRRLNSEVLNLRLTDSSHSDV